MIERPAAPFPTHPVPCRLWSILAIGIDRSRVCGLPHRRVRKTHGRGVSPIRLIRCVHPPCTAPRNPASLRRCGLMPRTHPPASPRRFCTFPGDDILHLALAAAHRPARPRGEGRLGTAPRLEPWISIIAAPPYPHAPRAAAHAMASPCSSGRPAGNPRHDLRGVTAAQEGRDDQRMRCRCPA